MGSKNRGALIAKALKVVKKHYKPAAILKDRSLLEHLIFACCLENSPHDAAEKAFAALRAEFFDWNEIRVSTIRELTEVLKSLNDPADSATRVKRILQSVFETHYAFDVEPLKKQNIGVAVKTIEKYNGSTPFIAAFATQQALGGHAIAVNRGLLESFRIVGIVTDAEAAKGLSPGIERAVPKNKGAEVGSQLHQLGVEMHRNPYGPAIRKILLEIDPDCKDALPKRSKVVEAAPPAPAVVVKPPSASPASAAKGGATPVKGAAPAGKVPPAKPAEAAKKAAAKPTAKPAEKPAPPAESRPAAKKVEKPKPTTKKPAGITKKPSAAKKIAKKKPR